MPHCGTSDAEPAGVSIEEMNSTAPDRSFHNLPSIVGAIREEADQALMGKYPVGFGVHDRLEKSCERIFLYGPFKPGGVQMPIPLIERGSRHQGRPRLRVTRISTRSASDSRFLSSQITASWFAEMRKISFSRQKLASI
jgi:hypothetical protein